MSIPSQTNTYYTGSQNIQNAEFLLFVVLRMLFLVTKIHRDKQDYR